MVLVTPVVYSMRTKLRVSIIPSKLFLAKFLVENRILLHMYSLNVDTYLDPWVNRDVLGYPPITPWGS